MDTLECKISKKLISIGVSPGLKGYGYLKSAIKKVYENPSAIDNMTKGLYPSVAAEAGTTASRAERAMRHAIERCFELSDPEQIQAVFGLVTDYRSGKVTNTTFIATMAEALHMEETEGGGDTHEVQ